MAFVERLIGPEEKLVGVARLHWFYGLQGLLWLIGLMAIGVIVKSFLAGLLDGGLAPIGNAVFWINTALGAAMATFYFIMMLSTELALTTQRCIYKKGLLFVDTREIDLEEIKSASVDNGFLGRILNYGYILLDARFIEDANLPAIADPYRFIKAMNEVREKIKEDSMHVILDQPAEGAIKTKDDMRNPDGEFDDSNKGHKSRKSRMSEDDTPDMDSSRYDAVSDNPAENIQDIATEAKGESLENKSEAKPEPEAKPKPKNSDDPLDKTVREHLKEEIIEDFDAAEGKKVQK